MQWPADALFLYCSNPEDDVWYPDLTSQPSKAFSLWISGRRVSTERYVSEERSGAGERSGGHPDWTIKGGSCCEFGVHFSDPSRMVACSRLVITCALCYASVKLGCPRGVRWDFFIWREHDCVSVCDIYFLCFGCHNRWELVQTQSSVEVSDVLPTFDLNLVNDNMPSGDHFGNCVCL